ncbi:hypothetical protein [Oryzifoliimicrobium ureilyticus]|uniref:hypothetical protein n=1 Tax=Oryzifoliimicrobium ureilyticus TaxID=3113724 RepID=UPI003076588B
MRAAPLALTFIAAALFSGAAYAQPGYSDESIADSNDTVPQKVEPMKHVTYKNSRQMEYSDESIADSNDTVPVRIERQKVDKMATASTRALPDCQSMLYKRDTIHTAGGDSGASETDACRATH